MHNLLLSENGSINEYTIRYKTLEGEDFGQIAHCNSWQVIFWRMPKSSRKSSVQEKRASAFTEQKLA